MKRDEIFEMYIDGVSAFEAGLTSASQYILEDTLALAEKHHAETENYHASHLGVLENLARVYIFLKNHENALDILNKARKIEPNNMRILYKLFMFHLETLPNEKLALEIYMDASKVHSEAVEFNINNELFKSFSSKGESIKNKRKTYLMMEENSQNTEIQAQNLVKQLPIEILAEIFKRLDISTLINLLSVCKYWRSTILGSPIIVGMFSFRNDLTYQSLEAYLRIFDQKIYTSEIMVNHLNITSDKSYDEFKRFKLLLSSKLQTRILNYKITNDFQSQMAKMIKESKSNLFKNLEQLNLTILSKPGALGVLPAFLQFTTNLKRLSIKLENVNSSRQQIPVIFRNKITLKKLEELDIQCKSYDYISNTKLHKYLDMPNLQKLTIDTASFKVIDAFLSITDGLKTLKITRYSIRDLISSLDSDLYFSHACEYLSNLEKLEFVGNASHGGHYNITEEMSSRISLKCLKTLSFDKTYISTKELTYFLECSQGTLENLYIDGRPNLRYEVSGVENSIADPTFNLKRLIETTPHIQSIKIRDSRINNRIFQALMFEIATLIKPVHLKYFDISGENLESQSYTILFLSIKEKLTIDHLRLWVTPNDQLKVFVDKAINSGEVKRVDFLRSSSH